MFVYKRHLVVSFLRRLSFRVFLIMAPLFLTAINAIAHHAYYVPQTAAKAQKDKAPSGSAMPNSPTATTLPRNHTVVGFAFNHLRYNSIPASNAHELHEQGRDVHGKKYENFYHLYFGYGVLDDLDVYLIAPLASRSSLQIHDEDNVGRKERASGFGDLRLLGKYRFWRENFEAALIAGIKFPTGEKARRDKSQAKFEPEQQPGSGSWDGEFGIAVSRSFRRRLSLSNSFQYTLRGEGSQGRKAGDVFRYNLGAAIALRELGEYPNLSFSLELNNEWVMRDHSRAEDKVFDSGGTAIFLTPGISADITRNLSAFLAIPVPLYQNLGGEHEELKFEVLTGMSIYF